MKKVLITLSLLAAASASAGQRPFDKLDVDGNNTLSKKEFLIYIKESNVPAMTKEFHRRDKNKDGELTLKEYTLKNM